MIEVKFIDKEGNIRSLDEILAIDSETGGLAIISHAELEAHHGHSFTVQAVDDTLADGEKVNIAFKTGGVNPKVHLVANCTTLVGGSLAIIEAPTWTQGSGTATAIINRLRVENPIQSTLLENDTVVAFTATNQVLVNVADLAGGTTLWTRYSWGERGKVEAGAERASNEFMLKPNTQYAVLFTAIGAANKAQIFLNWMEH